MPVCARRVEVSATTAAAAALGTQNLIVASWK
jgi:hypothetical protein